MKRRSAATAWGMAGGAVALTLLSTTVAHAEGRGDVRVTKTVVNGGKNVVVGTSKTITYPIAVTIRDNSGVKGLTDISVFNSDNGWGFSDWVGTQCEKKSSTTSVCTATMTVNPAWLPDSLPDPNTAAGTWQVDATVKAKDGDYWISDRIARFKMKRASKLTTNASPEPVVKGHKLTVTGSLTRASWKDLKYHGFSGQAVQLQFKKSGASRFSTVKTAKTSSTGKLSTTVTANSAGTWRWFFPGTTTTAQVASGGDAVKLK
ncbi:hypothetical protein ACWDO7_30835 [Streptomyces sp. NPDC003656]